MNPFCFFASLSCMKEGSVILNCESYLCEFVVFVDLVLYHKMESSKELHIISNKKDLFES